MVKSLRRIALYSLAVLLTSTAPAADGTAIQPPTFRMISGAGGLPISAMEWGNRSGPAILFLHGFSFSKEFWVRQQTSELSTRYHMVAIDLRGHGASGKPWESAQYKDTKIWADDVAAALKAFELTRPVIVGWSFGGFVAMDYLRHYDNASVAGVMLVSSPAGLVDALHPDTPGYPAAAAKQFSQDLADNIAGERFFVRLMTAKRLPASVEESWLVQTLRMPVYAREAMRGRPLVNKDLLPTLALPIRLLIGAQDRSMPVSAMRALTAEHSNMSFESIADAGHAVAYERASEFNRSLIAFAEKISAGPPPAAAR